jgi:hypothetical protein
MRYTPTTASETLESILDQYTMTTVIDFLACIASEKAEHVRSNWQDEPLARQWDRLSKTLEKAMVKVQRVEHGL